MRISAAPYFIGWLIYEVALEESIMRKAGGEVRLMLQKYRTSFTPGFNPL
jgi:hypothetical protein